jgi:hypothetical protein
VVGCWQRGEVRGLRFHPVLEGEAPPTAGRRRLLLVRLARRE